MFYVYTMPIALSVLWAILRVIRFVRDRPNYETFELWKKLGTNEGEFLKVLNDLDYQSGTNRVNSTGSETERNGITLTSRSGIAERE